MLAEVARRPLYTPSDPRGVHPDMSLLRASAGPPPRAAAAAAPPPAAAAAGTYSAAPAASHGDCDVFVPVFWETNDPANLREPRLPIYESDTIGDVRKRILEEGLSGGAPFSMRRRKVPMNPRNDVKRARDVFASENDYIILRDAV